MTKTWTGIKDSMKKYCEKFFSAVETWRNYENTEILANRIQLVATLCKIFHKDVYDESTTSYELQLQSDITENIDDNLLPEYVSKAKSDLDAFQQSRDLVLKDERIFKNVGCYFQDNLLKALAGWSPTMLDKSNKDTRQHLIDCTMLLFRLPESAGFVSIQRTCYNTTTSSSTSDVSTSSSNNDTIISIIPLVELNAIDLESGKDLDHTVLYKFLLKTRKKGYTSSSSQQIQRKPKKLSISNLNKITDIDRNIVDGENNNPSFSNDDIDNNIPSSSSSSTKKPRKQQQSKLHQKNNNDGNDSIGLKVLQYFETGKGPKKRQTPFVGEVTSYLPETAIGAKDEIWHIIWEDGDECDYDEKELKKGRKDWLEHTGNNSTSSATTTTASNKQGK